MDQSFRRTIPPSGSTPPSMPRQSKVISQRQYREKEGESFNALRVAINSLTGEDVQTLTRQEVLRKATDLLVTASRSKAPQAARPTATLAPGGLEYPPTGYVEPFHWSQSWESEPTTAKSDQSTFHLPQSHDQRHLMLNMDSYNQASYPGYSEDWAKFFQSRSI